MVRQVGPFRGYSVFDSLMRKSISEEMSASRVKQRETAVQQASGTASATGREATERIYGTSTRPTGDFASPFMADTSNFGRVGGQVVDLSKNPELRAAQGMERLTNAEAGAKAVTGTTGLRNYGRMGRVGLGVLSALDPTPFGAISGFIGGTTGVDPYGKTTFRPSGLLGLVADFNIEKQYDVAGKIKAGTPGYHQFYSGNRLVSLTPQTIGGKKLGYAVTGTTDLSSEQAIAQYATMFGYDPATVDLERRPGDLGFGQELGGFIPGVGGIGTDGRFVDTLGNRQGSPRDTNAYLGMVNDVYGQSAALEAAQSLGLGQDYSDAITSGLLTSKEYMNPDGTVAGYGTGTGGIVTTTDGVPVLGGSGYVSYGTGYKTPEQMQELSYQARTSQTYGTRMLSEQSRMLGEQDRDFRDDNEIDTVQGFTTRSGRDEDDRGGRDPGDLSEPGGPPDQGLGPDRDSSDTFFAEGGLVGDVAGEPVPEEAPVANGPGFVEEQPEQLPEGMTVADDVPLDVPEGTFVINAAAVEFAGSSDVKTMILEALAEAEKQGIDIEQQNSTIPKEELVSLVVSRGEVIIPPQLAEIIGYDRLNKINNRGKAEVAKRQAEAEAQQEQAQQEPQPQDPNIRAAAEGGAQYDDDTLVYARGALEAVEGIKNYPVVPTANSGLTVGLGLDLGQHSEFDLRNRYGMSEEFIEAAKPYLAPREGSKGPTGREAENLYKELGTTFDPYFEEIRDKYFRAKFDEFRSKYPEYQSAVPKDQGALFSMYYVGGLPRYSSFRKKYEETGDLPRSIDEGLLPLLSEGNEERNRAINLLTFYYTADDADVLRDYPTAGAQEAYAMDMLETQRRTRDIDSGAFAERRGMQEGGVVLPDYKDIALIPVEPDIDFSKLPSLEEILEFFKGPPSHVMSQTDVERGSTEGQRRFSNITGVTPQNATYIYQNMPTYRSIVSELPPESQAEATLALDRFEKEIARQVGGPLPEQNSPRGLNSMVTDRIGVITDRARKAAKEAKQTVSKTVVGDSGGFISKSY